MQHLHAPLREWWRGGFLRGGCRALCLHGEVVWEAREPLYWCTASALQGARGRLRAEMKKVCHHSSVASFTDAKSAAGRVWRLAQHVLPAGPDLTCVTVTVSEAEHSNKAIERFGKETRISGL